MVALPGGPAHATGTVLVSRRRSHPTLDLSVSDLPAVSHGHYEVWLYDSVVNSQALGPVGTRESHLSLRLPGNARRFHWIDISVQPAGRVFTAASRCCARPIRCSRRLPQTTADHPSASTVHHGAGTVHHS
jgi:hypothetical protein